MKKVLRWSEGKETSEVMCWFFCGVNPFILNASYMEGVLQCGPIWIINRIAFVQNWILTARYCRDVACRVSPVPPPNQVFGVLRANMFPPLFTFFLVQNPCRITDITWIIIGRKLLGKYASNMWGAPQPIWNRRDDRRQVAMRCMSSVRTLRWLLEGSVVEAVWGI